MSLVNFSEKEQEEHGSKGKGSQDLSGFISPNRIEEMISQVKDETLAAEDYNFLDEVSHPGPKKKGNKGLANLGAHLAVYEEDNSVKVDKELVSLLDNRQADKEEVYTRTRFENVVERIKDQETRGHGFLEDMIEDYKNHTSSSKTFEYTEMNGGETKMDYEEVNEQLDSTYNTLQSLGQTIDNLPEEQMGAEVETLEEDLSELGDYVQSLERAVSAANADVNELEEAVKRYDTLTEEFNDVIGGIEQKVDGYNSQLEDYQESHEEIYDDLRSLRDSIQGIGSGFNYNGPDEEVVGLMDEVLDDEQFEEFEEATSRFTSE